MKLALFAITLSAVVFVWPTQAAPGGSTGRWEKLFFPVMQQQMCGSPGHMVTLFKISPSACRRTFRYAAKYCRRAAYQLPFYRVKGRATGQVWGKWIGSCVGMAYDLKYTYKQPIP